jgi:transposase
MKMFDHYIGLEWANTNMVIARLSKNSKRPHVVDVKSSIRELQVYLDSLKGTKILTFEETTPSHWLYTELRDHVDAILVCDPYRNKLLSEGPKTDRIDACKLVELLKAGLLKAVYHEDHKFMYLRKLVSGYLDSQKALVRLKNQRSALLRGVGKGKRDTIEQEGEGRFVLESHERLISASEAEIAIYQGEFEKLRKQYREVRNVMTIPGIGTIGAVKIVAFVVDARRFKRDGNFHSYCGQIRHDRISGGRSYGTKKPRYNHVLKNVFDTAAVNIIGAQGNHSLYEYYRYLLEQKHCAEHEARRGLSRRVATIALSIMRSGKPYDPRRRETEKKDQG